VPKMRSEAKSFTRSGLKTNCRMLIVRVTLSSQKVRELSKITETFEELFFREKNYFGCPGASFIKLSLILYWNKLECLSMVVRSTLVYHLKVRVEQQDSTLTGCS